MPQQLWDTTMDPERRFLKRISVEDAAETDRMFRVLMGDQVSHASLACSKEPPVMLICPMFTRLDLVRSLSSMSARI